MYDVTYLVEASQTLGTEASVLVPVTNRYELLEGVAGWELQKGSRVGFLGGSLGH
jgi:hypothetical protein